MRWQFSLTIGALTTLTAGALVACSTEGEDSGTTDDALTGSACEATDQALFFHGLQGYGKEMKRPGICVPDITSFSGDVAYVAAPSAQTVTGYSAGRIPLLHRLQRGENKIKVAIMLDGSWADGRRYDGKTGPEIVSDWLAGGADRKFVLVYLADSAGWREYADLAGDAQLKSRMRVCKSTGGHFDLPKTVGPKLVLDTNKWLDEKCASGGGAFASLGDAGREASVDGGAVPPITEVDAATPPDEPADPPDDQQ